MSTEENRAEITVAVLDAIRGIETGNWTLAGFWNCRVSDTAKLEFSFRTFQRLVDTKLAEVTGQ
jgi:hypothetical protein